MKNEQDISLKQKEMVASVYCVIFCNSIATNYAIDTVDYISEYEHKFSKGVYKCLSTLEKRIDNSVNNMKKIIKNERSINFFFDSTNVNYRELEPYIKKFEMSVEMLCDKKKCLYSDVKAKIITTCVFTNFACNMVDRWIEHFGEGCINIGNGLFSYPRLTFLPMKITNVDSIARKLYGMICHENISLDDDINCVNGYAAIQNKLTSMDFFKKIFNETEDMQNGISKKKRETLDNINSVNKLREHFNCKSI